KLVEKLRAEMSPGMHIPENSRTGLMLISERPEESRAGDVLLLPIAGVAFWTLAYQLVLIAGWSAKTIGWCFLAIAIPGFLLLGRLFKKTNAMPGNGYRFHPSHILVLALAIAYGTSVLFVRRPNQDDVVYFHRALAQLSMLEQPISLRQTSVDMDAAAFSPVHLATSYEMLMAFLGHWLRIDPLYFYQVVAHVFAAFSLPFVFYWCTRRFGLNRWAAAIGAFLAIAFLLVADPSPLGVLLGAMAPRVAGQPLESINTAGLFGFATTSGYLWQGKPIVWILLLPIGLALTYRFLSHGNASDLAWLTLLGVAGVGLSNPALYLIPAVIGCSWIAFFGVERFERKPCEDCWKQIRRGFSLIVPLAYPIGILVLLSFNVIPKPIDVRMFGPTYMPWHKELDFVIGGPADYIRDAVLMIAVPLLIVQGRNGLFLFLYLCAVWLLCLNPLLAHWWMKNLFAYTYFRLVYLLQLPLLCAMLGSAGSRLIQPGQASKSRRLLTVSGLLVVLVSFLYTWRGLSIMPRDPNLGIGWKSPSEYQLLPANTNFARAAGRYIAHAKLLAPGWTASCELPLLFPEMKVVAPRLVTHYFANAGNPNEGMLRANAQAFVEGDKSGNLQRLRLLEPAFRQVIETGRANAVAVPDSESERVLTTLRSIDPGWHRVLEAGGLVLMLPSNTQPEI
ncbi:MAG: hypothetical protein J2P56_08660, partial [Verrucomicrobia bacterium]|nr:hypothetical protein [Verrucomicrobiota bacterium]